MTDHSSTSMIDPEDIATHMRGVQAAQQDLRELGLVWQMIEASASISCPEETATILPILNRTRERFELLREDLVAKMVQETRAELADELAAQAQGTIDILVRNLYERTADVGFLATDAVVRAFCATGSADAQSRETMRARLVEYQAKYTVYDDVILLSRAGRILARLDHAAGTAASVSSDTIVAEALAAPGFIERYRPSDLAAAATAGPPPHALLYAHRIVGEDNQAVGVLVLRFRFADEMQRIFRSMGDDRLQAVVVLLDDQQRVVTTNDEAQVPTGAALARVAGDGLTLGAYAGREYLTLCRRSGGYQGYQGPPWRAQAMVTAETAFRQRRPAGPDTAHTDGKGTGHVVLDSQQLAAINAAAEEINRDLRQVVWNGRLMAGLSGSPATNRLRLKAVLEQVHKAGDRTRLRVAKAIDELHRQSIGRAARQSRELARRAGDILDRNLYERANDCRWWALSPWLQDGLAARASPVGDRALCDALDHINGLYTVYTRLVAFDGTGIVRAASRAGSLPGMIGSLVPPAWLQAATGLPDSQRYAVSAFEDTGLHDQGPTYVFLAAVRAGVGGTRVGGIAVVFNARAEMQAMLKDVMGDRRGFAAFVQAPHDVLASTDDARASALARAGAAADGFETDGVHHACARVSTAGYREFKGVDGYDNHVQVIVALRAGTTTAGAPPSLAAGTIQAAASLSTTGGRPMEIAVFSLAGALYGLRASDVIGSIPAQALVRTRSHGGTLLGLVDASAAAGSPRLIPVLCGRRLLGTDVDAGVAADPAATTLSRVLLVIRSANDRAQAAFALAVDDVEAVMDAHDQHVQPLPPTMKALAHCVEGLIDCRRGEGASSVQLLLQLLDGSALTAAAGREIGEQRRAG